MGFSFRNIKYLFKAPVEVVAAPVMEDIPRYPPFDHGLPAVSVEQLLGSQAEIIDQIRKSLAFENPADFDRYAMPVIKCYAAQIHLLPASRGTHHRGAGGLFRHGLEVALYAIKGIGANPAHFSEENQRARRDSKPRWAFAAFVAGLLHDCAKPITDVMITTADGAQIWNPTEMLLLEWLTSNKIMRYYMTWRRDRAGHHDTYASLGFNLIIPRESLAYLTQPGPHIIAAVYDAISGMSITHPLSKAVSFADKESTERDIDMMRLKGDAHAVDTPVHRFVFDALRSLSGMLQINVPGAPIWVSKSGVFVVWSIMAPLVQRYLNEARIKGIPQNPDSLADLLIEKNFARINRPDKRSHGQRYWTIAPEVLEGITLRVLYFDSPRLIFTETIPEPVNIRIVSETEVSQPVVDTTAECQKTELVQVSQENDENTPVFVNHGNGNDTSGADLTQYGVVEYPNAVSEPDLQSAELNTLWPATAAWNLIGEFCEKAISGAAVFETLPAEILGLEYPSIVGLVGSAPDIRKTLLDEDLVQLDPLGGSVTRHRDRKYLALKLEVSRAIRQRLKESGIQPVITAKAKKASANRSTPAQSVTDAMLDSRFPPLHIFAQELIDQIIHGSGAFIEGEVIQEPWNELTKYIVQSKIENNIATHYGVERLWVKAQLRRVEDLQYDQATDRYVYAG